MAYSAILYRRPIFYKISASGETPPAPSISVTYTNSVGGTISTSGQTDVTEGTPFSNVATANTLFNFVEWLLSEDGGVTWVSISTDTELNYTYEGDSQSVTVKAMFEPDALNFYMPDGGTITLTKNGSPTVVELEYSIDGGATWQVWEEVGNVRSLTLAAGGKMYVRNTSDASMGFSTSARDYYKFSLSDDAYGEGDLRSLLCKNPKNGVSSYSCFFSLFLNESHLLSSPDLLFDDVEVQQCQNMLRGTSIGDVTLFSDALEQDSYRTLLMDCTNLTKITTYMTDISETNCLYLWVSGVAATGDFYCPAELTIQTGTSGIPTGWTRHDI